MKRGAIFIIIVPLIGIAYLLYDFAHGPWTLLRPPDVTGFATWHSGEGRNSPNSPPPANSTTG